MNKLFFDVFPDLKVPSGMENLMAEVEVTKVAANRKRDHLRVYLLSSRLIQKDHIYRLESDIQKQLFPNHNISIKIIEKFQLSGQYNPRKLMDAYKGSIMDEFRGYCLLEYNVLRMAQMEFRQEEQMHLTFEDSVVARQKSEEITRILEKIICERCGLGVKIQVDYQEPKEKKHKKNSDIQLQNEIHQIISQSAANRSQDGVFLDTAAADSQSAPFRPQEGVPFQNFQGAPFQSQEGIPFQNPQGAAFPSQENMPFQNPKGQLISPRAISHSRMPNWLLPGSGKQYSQLEL